MDWGFFSITWFDVLEFCHGFLSWVAIFFLQFTIISIYTSPEPGDFSPQTEFGSSWYVSMWQRPFILMQSWSEMGFFLILIVLFEVLQLCHVFLRWVATFSCLSLLSSTFLPLPVHNLVISVHRKVLILPISVYDRAPWHRHGVQMKWHYDIDCVAWKC